MRDRRQGLRWLPCALLLGLPAVAHAGEDLPSSVTLSQGAPGHAQFELRWSKDGRRTVGWSEREDVRVADGVSERVRVGAAQDDGMESVFDDAPHRSRPASTGVLVLGAAGAQRLVEEAPGPSAGGCRPQRLLLGARVVLTDACVPEGALSNTVQIAYVAERSRLAVAWNVRVTAPGAPPRERGHHTVIDLDEGPFQRPVEGGTHVTLLGWVGDTLVLREQRLVVEHGPRSALFSSLVVLDGDGKRLGAYREGTTLDDADPRALAASAPREWTALPDGTAFERWRAGRTLVAAQEKASVQVVDRERVAHLLLHEEEPGGACTPTTVSLALEPRGARRALSHGCVSHHEDSELAWSSTATHLAVVWRHALPGESAPARAAQVAVLAWNALPAIELLDAGAGKALPAVRKALSAAGFRVTREGRARSARTTTVVFATREARPSALELAHTLGLAPDAVQLLTWAAGADIVVAAGGGSR